MFKTEKLYELDSYMKTFEATVLSQQQNPDGTYTVILDKTAFFPEEGGQDSDTGTLAGIRVLKVRIAADEICHIIEAPLKVGFTVQGVIDFDLRLEKMQCHTAEHIVCGLIHREYGFDNEDPEYEYVGFVNGEDSSVLAGSLTFKYDSSVTKESAIGEYEDVITADSLATSNNYSLTVVYPDGNGADLSIIKVSVKTIMAPLDGVTEDNVTSDNEAAINEVIAELNEFTPENEEEQKQLQEALDKCNSLLAKIEEARKALGEAEEESAVLDKERATVFWEDDIEEFLDKINSLLENPNMSPSEIEKLEGYKAQAEEILEIIHAPIEYISLRFFYLIWDFLTWMYNGIGQLFSNLFNIG